MKPPKFRKCDVEVAQKSVAYDGFFRVDIYDFKHRRFDGEWNISIRREIFERGHAVAVIPYDPIRDEVILIEQFRAGAFAASQSKWFADDYSPWLYEGVAGIIDPGESPEDVARRECVEETGTPVTDLFPVCHYLVSPGGSTESVFVFIGRADTGNVNGHHGVRHEGEDIRPFVVALDEAYAAVEDGTVNNGMTIIGLQWLMLNRERVRAAWR